MKIKPRKGLQIRYKIKQKRIKDDLILFAQATRRMDLLLTRGRTV